MSKLTFFRRVLAFFFILNPFLPLLSLLLPITYYSTEVLFMQEWVVIFTVISFVAPFVLSIPSVFISNSFRLALGLNPADERDEDQKKLIEILTYKFFYYGTLIGVMLLVLVGFYMNLHLQKSLTQVEFFSATLLLLFIANFIFFYSFCTKFAIALFLDTTEKEDLQGVNFSKFTGIIFKNIGVYLLVIASVFGIFYTQSIQDSYKEFSLNPSDIKNLSFTGRSIVSITVDPSLKETKVRVSGTKWSLNGMGADDTATVYFGAGELEQRPYREFHVNLSDSYSSERLFSKPVIFVETPYIYNLSAFFDAQVFVSGVNNTCIKQDSYNLYAQYASINTGCFETQSTTIQDDTGKFSFTNGVISKTKKLNIFTQGETSDYSNIESESVQFESFVAMYNTSTSARLGMFKDLKYCLIDENQRLIIKPELKETATISKLQKPGDKYECKGKLVLE
jgi:hypothetical protein